MTGQDFDTVCTSGYGGKPGELWYVRLCPPILDLVEYHVAITTPYILTQASKSDWVAYLNRARLRLKNVDEDHRLHDLLKYGPSVRHWNEFVFQAYHHHQHDAIFLAGLPDVKGSLPHAENPTEAFSMPSKDQQRWKRLAALGAKREIPTPEGEARMSAVILEVAKPLLNEYAETPERVKTVIMLVVAGWNKSLFPPDKQPVVEKEIIDHLVSEDGSGEVVGVVVDIMDTAAARRENLFPDLRKIIVDYEVEISGDSLNLDVTSAPVPDVWCE